MVSQDEMLVHDWHFYHHLTTNIISHDARICVIYLDKTSIKPRPKFKSIQQTICSNAPCQTKTDKSYGHVLNIIMLEIR